MGIVYDESLDYYKVEKKDGYSRKEENKKDKYTYDINIAKECNYISKSIDLNLEPGDKEKYLDIEMDISRYMRVCGVVKDLEGNVIKNTKIGIFKSQLINYKTEYIEVCNMITDEYGIYEAVVDREYKDSHYIVKIK